MTRREDPDHDAVLATAQRDLDHLVVVAPPGTGKTFLSVRLAGRLAAHLGRSERVLLVTFSNQARTQLEQEAAKQLHSEIRARVEVTNYHAFFRREVWAYRRLLGVPLDAQIGSYRRRLSALSRTNAALVSQLQGHPGLLEAFAEQRFPAFRDDRTPDDADCARLLSAIDAELQAGRLIFDDLGALFWQLLEGQPLLARAYGLRYPVVIADEHQDASELQDAFVRRLGRKRLVIFADPMQIIYGFRGSTPERLDRHLAEVGPGATYALKTPHRWHGRERVGEWLLAVRRRLNGETDATPPPPELKIIHAGHEGQMKARTKEIVATHLGEGMHTVAVLAMSNRDVASLRGYLCRSGMYPRQVGGSADFEESREAIEELPLLPDAAAVAGHALGRLRKLVPTLDDHVAGAVARRIMPGGVSLKGHVNEEASGLLGALGEIYVRGSGYYFAALSRALDSCQAHGHHLPRPEAVCAIKAAGDAARVGSLALSEAIARYAEQTALAAQKAFRLGRGLYVMTAHQSKGKEFDSVILFNASGWGFPASDEGRRLFYVVVTRATRRWTIIAPQEDPSPLLMHLEC